MEDNRKGLEEKQDERIELETKLREEDWSVINNLYASSFKELVER